MEKQLRQPWIYLMLDWMYQVFVIMCKKGNVGEAVDDGLATVAACVPGGAGAGLKAYRMGKMLRKL